MSLVSFLARPGEHRLAYALTPGRLPGVVFLGGFKSDMTGAKAIALEAFCRDRGQRFLRFDYSGHGQSSGDFRAGTIGAWKAEALVMLDNIAPGENILVGSSMGAWIMLLTALAQPEKVSGLVGIASAPDFTETLIWKKFSATQQKQMMDEDEVLIPDCYGKEPYPITRYLIEEAREHLCLGGEIPIRCPVRLIHGMADEDVPWDISVALMTQLASRDVTLTLVKGGNHRLSEPEHLKLICETVKSFCQPDKLAL